MRGSGGRGTAQPCRTLRSAQGSRIAAAAVAVVALQAMACCAFAAVEIPHVNDCNYCQKCHLEPSSAASSHHRHLLQQQQQQQQKQQLERDQELQRQRRLLATYQGQRALLSGERGSSSADADGTLPDPAASARWELVGQEASARAREAAVASGIPGAIHNPAEVMSHLIRPHDHESKQLKPNCTECYGCSSTLEDMHAAPVEAGPGIGGLAFMHGKGATNGWLLFGRVPGSSKRYIVKVYCMPYSKAHGKPQDCASEVYTERMRLMMAQVRLADECDATGITPRVWVAPVNAVIPNGTHKGYHVRWHGLWMEEAPGITLHGLFVARAEAIMYGLLTRRMNKTQVIQQTVLDLLTAQCDRHSENVFITEDGSLTFIDNDRALGVVTRCGGDSMLLPGNRYHTQLRTGYWGPTLTYYKEHGKRPGFCTGPIDIRVLIDYRCYVEGGRIGTGYLPGLRTCMEGLASSNVSAVMARYGFSDHNRKAAEILLRRSRDMLALGFEGALADSPPRSAPRYVFQAQPPCCGIVMDLRGTPRCAQCWQPIIEELKDSVRDHPGATKEKEVLVGPKDG